MALRSPLTLLLWLSLVPLILVPVFMLRLLNSTSGSLHKADKGQFHRSGEERIQQVINIAEKMNMIEGLMDDLKEGKFRSLSDGAGVKSSKTGESDGRIAILIIACNRPSVTQLIERVFSITKSDQFSVIVSQDCSHTETANAIQQYKQRLLYITQPDQSRPAIKKGHEHLEGYYRISRHYKWALKQVFDILLYRQVIILEDDLLVSNDFFDYFLAFLPLLQSDSTLWCISSWNDNGKAQRANDERIFYRTDFFPGLGWMMTRSLWNELKEKWPDQFWDDWMRDEQQRKGRPELSRTKNIGRIGVSSQSEVFDQHFSKNVIADKKAVFETYLPKTTTRTDPNAIDVKQFEAGIYDRWFFEQVYERATLSTTSDLKMFLDRAAPTTDPLYISNANMVSVKSASLHDVTEFAVNTIEFCGRSCTKRYRIEYDASGPEAKQTLSKLVAEWDLVSDIRAGFVRTEYCGVVSFKAPFTNSQENAKLKNEWIMIHIAPKYRPARCSSSQQH